MRDFDLRSVRGQETQPVLPEHLQVHQPIRIQITHCIQRKASFIARREHRIIGTEVFQIIHLNDRIQYFIGLFL